MDQSLDFTAKFLPANHTTIKLEGAERVGCQAVIIAGVREPYILAQLDSWLAAMRSHFAARAVEVLGREVEHDIHVRVYGRDAAMGALEPHCDR